MELKKYQESVLKDLDTYIENILDTGNAAKAYDKIWRDKGVRVGGVDGLQLYKDVLNGVPSVCFKVPTGGGKTILGCASLKHIFDAMGENKKKVVVWLVPWDTILNQTYNNLKDSTHFYRERINRDFSSKVEIYNKQQVLSGTNFSPSSVGDQLSIIIMSFDSLRSNNKENRKVYEENSSLMPFVDTFENKDELIKGVDNSSLMQVLNQMKPVVIIDESHNAQSELSKEMIKNLNPSFVLELTATPKSDSNIISIVTANQLKEENMVKLPVIAYNRPSVDRVIMEALDLRNALEKAAIKERTENNAPYIRPIILFQAQPKNDDDSVTFEKLKENLIEIGIPKEEIAIKTANKNELSGINLMSPECKIKFIITINALKEGWDCPFAYVLASLANRSSRIDVEQILGRILRQPYQKKYANKILNMSYVLTSSSDFSSTLDNILIGLNSAGFTKNDCRVIRTNTLDNLTGTKQEAHYEQTTLFNDSSSESNDIDTNIFSVVAVKNELTNRLSQKSQEDLIHSAENTNGLVSENDNINKMLVLAENKNDEFEKQIENSLREGILNIPDEVRTYTNVFCVNKEHKEEITKLKLPIFSYKKEGLLFSGDNAIYPVDYDYLNDGFTLDSQPIPTDLTVSIDNIYKIDVESNSSGSIVKKTILNKDDSNEFKKYLSLIPEQGRIRVCKQKLVSDLNNKFDNIPYGSIVKYVDRIIDSFKTEDDMIFLQNNIYAIVQKIKEFINKKLEEYRYENFKTKLNRNEIIINKNYALPLSITLPNHTSSYFKTLYIEEDSNINSLEEKFVTKVSSLSNVKWWHRNIERVGYHLNGYINHYPDFILETNDGYIILVETKGEHLDGDDSKKKLELGKLWANYSGPMKYKYLMAFEKTPLVEDCSDTLDSIIDLISRL